MCVFNKKQKPVMRGHPNFILIISLLGIVVAYDINVTDLPQVGKSCQRGICDNHVPQ